ncbi:histidine triad nucleotide-binding protein [bacterium (Candidatus Gribaldobacteria) CG07_land_8_20_14_0_80_33_18]|uniref:Histidine triad nucleotide-binding protein n=1 Tax=bacterium (Candidatus Gribaldobacteria) CG07_land_8_20_14_0_80_33_18 TaxID=2014272 RepID=A0A2M6Z356_9BACT|nr:MAG: histidine triad nucleotide-binding protein [bacterium (Candidatus Gribaldobacteria) CG10_big_fil_rev_8_21_14_0_10_33_41]PIU46802.1 MAG: histidine triad nucleotide-binding protein [bacterium (Candidatus Gribaldobacteria) CG07_land_8_20_14_0_80_33_18]PJA00712.1 MAG: histidine triad nucleotide-binding protein [bacterium (Candidatus Gribaldobacteria) CG_4_10_14_0_2_um_filter_33_15]PJB08280.1 MAG: histidine triad nucleotide-binding protein [bacterium (Candidatus Gribaldobacteria) CG_4_9_14_3_
MECIFCKIINKEIPSEIVFEDDEFIAFKDVNPQAPVHILIIPKKHISSVNHVEIEDKTLMGELILVAQKIAREKNLAGYKLLINVGREGGQLINHLHLHLLSGLSHLKSLNI